MYMKRCNDRSYRRVLNEPALLSAIRALLEERGKGEELVVFVET